MRANKTYAEELIEEGIQIGMERHQPEIRAKAILLERRRILRRALDKRFGGGSSAYLSRLEAASADELHIWMERLWDAASIEEVFGD